MPYALTDEPAAASRKVRLIGRAAQVLRVVIAISPPFFAWYAVAVEHVPLQVLILRTLSVIGAWTATTRVIDTARGIRSAIRRRRRNRA